MVKSSFKVTLLALLVCFILLGAGSAALAASWPDMESSTLVAYGVTAGQLSQVSSGFTDGNWRPWQTITRGQFAKMAALAFGLEPGAPAAPTFADVPADHQFYQYIEAVHAAGLMGGTGDGLFEPSIPLTREQAIAVVARKAAADEGFDLATMTETDIAGELEDFGDADAISAGLRDEVAFAVSRVLARGTAAGNLFPQADVSRIAAAAFIIRAMGPQFVIDSTANGSTITVRTGDVITVVLKGNPTTGYTWMPALSEEDAAILEQMGEPAYVSDSDLIGSGGTFTFRFKAVAAGEAVLKLVYLRPWESVQPLETFSVTVKVVESPLEDTSWKVQAWSVSSIAPGDFELTARFEDGRIAGTSAVNSYSGPYTVGRNGALSIGDIISTKMAGPEPAMRAETTYFQLLDQVGAYRLTGGKLILLDANLNELLIFAPVS